LKGREMMEPIEYLRKMSTQELVHMSQELTLPVIPEGSMIRRVVGEIYGDVGPFIIVHCVGLSIPLAVVLGERLDQMLGLGDE